MKHVHDENGGAGILVCCSWDGSTSILRQAGTSADVFESVRFDLCCAVRAFQAGWLTAPSGHQSLCLVYATSDNELRLFADVERSLRGCSCSKRDPAVCTRHHVREWLETWYALRDSCLPQNTLLRKYGSSRVHEVVHRYTRRPLRLECLRKYKELLQQERRDRDNTFNDGAAATTRLLDNLPDEGAAHVRRTRK